MKKSFYWSVAFVGVFALVSLFAQSTQAQAQVGKIDICHKTGPTWQYMETPAGPSFDGHVSHGDFVYGGPVEGTDEVKGQWCSDNAATEAPICTPTDILIVSDDETSFINDGTYPAVEVTPHTVWDDYGTLPAGASWIWNAEKVPADDSGSHPAGTVTFTRNFEIVGTPMGAVLEITADNEYTVSINGNEIGDDNDWQTVESYLIDASDLQPGTNNITVVAVNGAGESGNPAGLIFRLEVDSEECPEPVTEATLHTQKIVCDEESDLPNWGAGGSDITSTTASDWMEEFGEELGCTLENWDFQWGYATQTTDPDDNLADAGTGWNTFSGSVEIDVINENDIRVRESADADYIGFTGQVTDQPVSAEVYCGTDVLHYDNWEWIDDVVAGEDYYCVAWNVPLEPAEPNFCEGNLLDNGGFEEAEVTNGAMWELFASIPGWMIDWTDGNENDTPMFELQEGVNGWFAQSGDQYIELDSDRPDTQANTKVWQDIATDDEKTYELSYQFSPRPNTLSADNTVEVWWNGNLVDTVGADNLTTNTVWTLEGATGLAGVDGSSSLEFRSVGTSNEYGAFVDSVCLVEVEAEACRLEVVSLEGDEGVVNGDAVEAWNHPSWATNLNAFADWIWDAEYVNDPEVDEARTFAKSFWVTGPVNDATLTFAADNRYWIEINGDEVASSTAELNYGTTQTLDVESFIDEDALNTIVMKIENIGVVGETEEGNPAAGIYQLIINAAEENNMCEPVEIPQCSDGIDNDNDGYTDFEGQDPGCDSSEDDDEYNEEPQGPDYGPYCGDGEIDETWEQCDPGLVSKDSIAIDNEGSCNQYCQFDNQCSNLVVARVITDNVDNVDPDSASGINSEDMTADLFIGGGVEGTNNIPGGTWFPVVLGDGTVLDDAANYDSYEDVPGYAVDREDGVVRVRMHGSHEVPPRIAQPTEHADGTIEIVHAFSGTSVLTGMESQFIQNRLELPFNGTAGGPGNDELYLGDDLGDFWMTVAREDDGFRAEYSVEDLPACEGNVTICKQNEYGTPLNGWQVMLLGNLADEVTVNPDGNDYDSDSLVAGDYVVLANGEYVYRGTAGAENSDAAYSERDPSDGVYGGPFVPWVRENDFPMPNTGWLGIIMNDSFTDWGNIFNPAHQYAVGTTTSGVQSFKILDDQYGDNSGSIEMDIYEGWMGITGSQEETGCYTFENVPVGEYTVAEIMQDGWSHNSETDDLGEVVVDGNELFTIVNDEDGQECDPEYEDCDDVESSITIWKDVVGTEEAISFDFTFGEDSNFDLSDDNSQLFDGLVAGTYTITEEELEGDWALTGVTCGDGVEYAVNGNVLTVYLSEDQDVSCTFTNTYEEDGGSGDDECLVEGYKYDSETGLPLAGWEIGLSGYVYYPSLQEIVVDGGNQILATTTTNSLGHYCISEDVLGYNEAGSNYTVGENYGDHTGWEIDHVTVEGTTTPHFLAGFFDVYVPVELPGYDETLHVNFYNTDGEDTPEVPGDDDDNGRRSGSNRNSFSGGGEVLGATTETNFCPFLRDYQHINMENDPSEVNKAKAFFNSYLGLALTLNGTFDMSMFNAVVQFQNMFKPDVLDTWTEEFPGVLDDNATGYLYQTTKWKINSIICPGYETFPDQLIMAPGTTI